VNATLEVAFNAYGIPEIINTDQGGQFTSSEYIDFIKSKRSIQISMDGKGRAIDNVYIERF
jgi:putative transposase